MNTAVQDNQAAGTILCCCNDDENGRLAAGIPDCTLLREDSVPAVKPLLLLIQATGENRWNLAWQCAKKKIPLALFDVEDRDFSCLAGAAAAAARNKVPCFLLNSWRYIPAAAALKEIVSSGCLGSDVTACALFPQSLHTPLNDLKIRDLLSSLASNFSFISDTAPENDVKIELHGTNGFVTADFSLDGQSAKFTKCLAGRKVERKLPAANPFLSELAVLSLALKGLTKVRKINLLTDVTELLLCKK